MREMGRWPARRRGWMATVLLGSLAVGGAAFAQEPGTAPETTPVAQNPAAAPPSIPPAGASTTAPPAQAPAAPYASAPPVSAPLVAATPGTETAAPQAPGTLPAKTYVVPAGTKVLLTLTSSINTKSANPGDGVYLVSAFPVVVGNRVLIPAGMYVQGTVDSVERHIRIKGHAKLNMHFTSMIFPNGSVVEIPGVINDIPGSRGPKVKNGEGTVEQTGSAGEVIKAAGQGAEVGVTPGVIVGAVEDHPFSGVGVGAAGGALIGAAVSLFTHGNDIEILSGSQVEMVLQRPLVLEDANLTGASTSPPQFVPAVQPRPMQKPNSRRVLCPLGVLCQ